MTAPASQAVNLQLLRAELHAVLASHGLADPDEIDIDVRVITQGGHVAGATVSAYRRPAALPAPTVQVAADEDAAITGAFADIVQQVQRMGDAS